MADTLAMRAARTGCWPLKRRLSAAYRAAYHGCWLAITESTSSLADARALRLEAGRVCALAAEYERDEAELALARSQRETGKGRRPSASAVDRLAHRMLVASAAYGEAHERFMAHPDIARRRQEARHAALRARVAAGRGETAAPVALAGSGGRDGNRQADDWAARG